MHGEIIYAKDVNKERLEKILSTENNIEYLENKLEEAKEEIDKITPLSKDLKIMVKVLKWMKLFLPILIYAIAFFPYDPDMSWLWQYVYPILPSGFMYALCYLFSKLFQVRSNEIERSLIRRLKAKKILKQDIEKEREKQKSLEPLVEDSYEMAKVNNDDLEGYEIKYNHIINYGLPTSLMEETIIDEEVEEKGKVKTLNRK